ncbi:hypothetical protein Fmac_010868 [Flemingia macrophylla]|uniref:G protein gamma domain-containing protein n=1 Tax=Flemingia macrophylla TaxID=520843 RepID=A0ABD1MLL6_9FABA
MEQLMRPKSPPPGPVDFHSKRKQMGKIQVLETEIGLLQEELKSLEGIHPASRCCKELYAFVGSVSDPFTPTWVLHKKMAKGCCWACCTCSSAHNKCCGCFKSESRCAQNQNGCC